MRIPDNFDLFDKHDRQQAEAEKLLPVCDWCGEHIHDEMCYRFDDEIVCERCVAQCHHDTDNYTW